ncbi:hypothetical protein NQ314_010519 [Rhamnusium bicolor]|uniref:Uncharacterized protein n=1 Tax=Rhamnusium bicolor TaxID=1586634 RepID=A0AAV8XR63_9CUCU|nr:hypothetical protein NQ314_010519 [Rhamnusium bicolor]
MEAVILKGSRRKRKEVSFELKGVEVRPSKSVKYLGITLDNEGTFGEHIKRVVKKAEGRATILSR